MINRRVDIARKRAGKAQKKVCFPETWRNFGAPGERSERRSRITHLKPFHALSETLDSFTRKFEFWRTWPCERMSAQLTADGKRVRHHAVSRATCKPLLIWLAATPLC